MNCSSSNARGIAAQITFHQSSLAGAGCRSEVIPVELGVGPDSSLWAAALDLQIEPNVMKRILNYPEFAHFYRAHRIFVNLHVVLKVAPRGTLARRVRSLIANRLSLFHPINWSN
jgi:hypothetical protein